MSSGQITSPCSVLVQAKEGKLSGDDMSGGTFTISNLGMFKVDQFAAIVNPPQVRGRCQPTQGRSWPLLP